MPYDNADLNPYQSPTESAEQEQPPTNDAPSTMPLFWRVMFVALSCGVGVFAMADTVVEILYFFACLDGNITSLPSTGSLLGVLVFAGGAAILAFSFFFAAIAVWMGYRRKSIAAMLLGLVVLAATQLLAGWLGT